MKLKVVNNWLVNYLLNYIFQYFNKVRAKLSVLFFNKDILIFFYAIYKFYVNKHIRFVYMSVCVHVRVSACVCKITKSWQQRSLTVIIQARCTHDTPNARTAMKPACSQQRGNRNFMISYILGSYCFCSIRTLSVSFVISYDQYSTQAHTHTHTQTYASINTYINDQEIEALH